MRRHRRRTIAVIGVVASALMAALCIPAMAQEMAKEKICQLCHQKDQGASPAVTAKYMETLHAKAQGEGPRYNANEGQPGVGCQVCHGPGAEHVRAAAEAKKDTIKSPAKLETREARLSLCGHCHGQYEVRGENVADPSFLADYKYGDNMFDKITLKPMSAEKTKLEQVNEMQNSLHFTSAKGPTCIDCHTGHKDLDPSLPHQTTDAGNQVCLKCHSPETADVRHCTATFPADALCKSCHMPDNRHIIKVAPAG